MDRIEVVYALPDRQRVVSIEFAEGITAAAAVQASGLVREFPELAGTPALGIYGERVGPERLLRPGDRVEIYRPLRCDPREARRARAAQAVIRRRGPRR